jgi:excisionase family DNA binding protein
VWPSPSDRNARSRRSASKLIEASEGIRCNASSVFLSRPKIPLPPLISKCARTAATVLGCTRELSGVRIDVDRRAANSLPVEFCEVGGAVRYCRREKDGTGELPITPSNPPSEGPKSIPFVQRLTCTIDEAREVTGLGRTKLYELIGTGHLATTTVGRRRLVFVSSLRALLDVNPSEPGGMKKIW